MGQQTYELAIQAAIRDVAPPSCQFQSRSVGSLRSPATLRAPARLLQQSRGARLVGRVAGWGADLVHRFDLRVPPTAGRDVVTVHDLPPMRFADEGSMPAWSRTSLRGGEVICPSQFAASEVAELLGADRITVIPYGVRGSFMRPAPTPRPELLELGIDGPFFLHAAGATERKNLRGLADAWRVASSQQVEHSLVLIGPPHPRRNELFAGLPRVVMPGRVDLDEVGRLMAAAEAVVVPSIYEGFGLPALEGMAVGVPVIAARRGALPEVCGDAGIVVEPDGASLADAMVAVARAEVNRQSLVEAGLRRAAQFDWLEAGRKHIQVYERLLLEP